MKANGCERDFLPPDLDRFYYEFEKARLWFQDGDSMVQILSRNEIESVDWGEDMDDFTARGPDHRTWHRFGVLSSGEYLAINLEGSLVRVADKERNRGRVFSLFHPICVYSEATRGVEGMNPVIALSFT